LGIPRIFGSRQINLEDQHDVTSLTLLSNDDFFGTVNDKVAALIVHALFVSDDLLVVAITQMALT